jgi:hypothetical protein
VTKVCGFQRVTRKEGKKGREGKGGKDTGSLWHSLSPLTVFVHFGIDTLQWPAALWAKYLYLGIFNPKPTSGLKD